MFTLHLVLQNVTAMRGNCRNSTYEEVTDSLMHCTYAVCKTNGSAHKVIHILWYSHVYEGYVCHVQMDELLPLSEVILFANVADDYQPYLFPLMFTK